MRIKKRNRNKSKLYRYAGVYFKDKFFKEVQRINNEIKMEGVWKRWKPS